jgi:hypothetical protein
LSAAERKNKKMPMLLLLLPLAFTVFCMTESLSVWQ